MKNKNEINIRSSCAEYLTYIFTAADSIESIEMRYEAINFVNKY